MKLLYNWYNALTSFQEVYSLQIHFGKDGQLLYRGAKFRRKGEELELEGDLIVSSDLIEVQNKAGSLPLVLNLTGKGVLFKRSDSEKADLALVKDTFPQIQVEDFHFQVNQLKEGQLVSILRKNQLDFLWDAWPAIKQNCVCWHLGIGTHSLLLQNDMELSCYSLSYENGFLKAIHSIPEEVNSSLTIGDEQIPSDQALLQLGAAACLYQVQASASSEDPLTANNSNTLSEAFLIKKGAVVAICLTLALVLGNFFAFNYFSEALNEASIQKMSVEKEMRLLERQQQQFVEQQELFNKLNFKEETHHSELADLIASKAGKSIQFTSISIFPELDTRSAKKSLAFDRNKLVITGKSKNSEEFKRFTSSLAELELLSEVQMTQFARDPKVRAYDFKLMATLNEK